MKKNIFIIFSVIILLVTILFLLDHLLYNGDKPTTKGLESACYNNLRHIYNALVLYSYDNGGLYPAPDGVQGLELLRRFGYIKDNDIFICPLSNAVSLSDGDVFTENNVSYNYKGGLSEGDLDVICWDKESNHKVNLNVLFTNGYIGKYDLAHWRNEVKKYIFQEKKAGDERGSSPAIDLEQPK